MTKLGPLELKQLFQKMLNENPLLTASGFGVNPTIMSQKQGRFDSERQTLEGEFFEFLIAYDWIDELDAIRRGKFPTRMSYGWKHDVEKDTGEYISQGSFIIAALAHGCEMSPGEDAMSVYLTFP